LRVCFSKNGKIFSLFKKDLAAHFKSEDEETKNGKNGVMGLAKIRRQNPQKYDGAVFE